MEPVSSSSNPIGMDVTDHLSEIANLKQQVMELEKKLAKVYNNEP